MSPALRTRDTASRRRPALTKLQALSIGPTWPVALPLDARQYRVMSEADERDYSDELRVIQRVATTQVAEDVAKLEDRVGRLERKVDRLGELPASVARIEATVKMIADSRERRAIVETEARVEEIEVRKTGKIAAIRDQRDARKARRAMMVAITAAAATIATALATRC